MVVSPFTTAPRPHVDLEPVPAQVFDRELSDSALKDVNSALTELRITEQTEQSQQTELRKGRALTAKGRDDDDLLARLDVVTQIASGDKYPASVRTTARQEVARLTAMMTKRGLTVPTTPAKRKAAGKKLPKISDDLAAARALGIEMGDQGWFQCPMPGHDGGVASFEESADGDLRMSCDCFGVDLKGKRAFRSEYRYPLSDAYYSVISGRVLAPSSNKVPAGVRFVWRLLLLAATGTVQPLPVDMAALPADAHDDLHRARELVITLVGVRMAVEDVLQIPATPVQLSENLVGAWCRISNPRAVINGLITAGVLRQTGRAPLARGQVRSAFLYEPVSQPERSRSNARGTLPCLSQPSSH